MVAFRVRRALPAPTSQADELRSAVGVLGAAVLAGKVEPAAGRRVVGAIAIATVWTCCHRGGA